jgi:AcrR family transcriptional regulator
MYNGFIPTRFQKGSFFMSKQQISPRKNGIQDRAKDTVNFIIEATTQLLEEKGIKGLSTNKIVERAGISIGTLYQYFPNKESIIHHLIENLFNKMADDMVKTIEELDLKEKELKEAIDLLVEKFFARHENKKTLLSEFLLSVVSVEHLKFMIQNDQKISAALKTKFSPYTEELKITDWDATIFMVIYAIKGIHFGLLFSPFKVPQEQIRKEVSRMIFGYLKEIK